MLNYLILGWVFLSAKIHIIKSFELQFIILAKTTPSPPLKQLPTIEFEMCILKAGLYLYQYISVGPSRYSLADSSYH